MIPQETPTEEIKQLILRFLEGEASDQDVSDLQVWLQESAGNRLYFDEVNNAYQASVTLHRFNQQKIDQAWSKLSEQLDTEQHVKEVNFFPRVSQFPFFKIAASISILLLSSFLIFWLLGKKETLLNTIVQNNERNSIQIVLPDSSVVWLNSYSSLVYPTAFDKHSRDVTLKGEAFFDVKKGKKPFIVHTQNMQVRVKGTRFNVEAYTDNPSAKTTLEEGKVELFVNNSNKKYILKPGEQIIFNAPLNKVSLRKVKADNFSAWKEKQLVFDNTPLQEIIPKLENRFSVAISADDELAATERLSLTIENETLDEVLELVKLASRLKVKKEKGQIILYE
ncbi:MAG TPA: FecR domain-containing protein [Cyclobacteriaceae bacterium]|jgi:ferric-dicitrate binding protein FerR (iron transport regulator)|nr:FecR domain-containing protein [Cyclobacteriaceae bacterium]